MELKRLYTVADGRIVPGLGIKGPITTPTEMEITDVLKMVTSKYEVYQHNPYNNNEKVRVTLTNLRSIEFSMADGLKAVKATEKKNKEKKDYTVEVVHKDQNNNDNNYNGKKKDKHNKGRYEDNNQAVDEREERVNKPDAFEKK